MPDSPTVYHAGSQPIRESKPRLTFRYAAGEIGLSIALYRLLNAQDNRRVVFVAYKNSWYVTRVDTGGFWLNVNHRQKYGAYSVSIAAKQFVQQTLRKMGHGPGENVTVPIAPHLVEAADLQLDPQQYPYPFYRLVTDQKTVKS